MIPIRIAARLTATGIDGVRWVLVDEQEGGNGGELAQQTAAEAEPAAGRRSTLRWLLQAAVVSVALAAAALTTHVLLGRADGRAPAAERTVPPTQTKATTVPGGNVSAQTPAASAAVAVSPSTTAPSR